MSNVKTSPDLLVDPSFHRKSKYERHAEKNHTSEESIVIEQLRKIDRLFVERDPSQIKGQYCLIQELHLWDESEIGEK